MSAALLLTALVLAPVIGGGFGELANGVLQILVLGAVIAHLVVARGERAKWIRVPGLLPLLLFFAAIIVSMVYSESIYASLNQLLLVAACLAAYALSATLSRSIRVSITAIWAAALSALGICAMGIRHYAISTGGGMEFWQSILTTGEHMRLFGPFINPGFFSGYLVIALPLTLALYLVTRRTMFAVVAGIGVVVDTLALMLTGTKFGIVSAGVAMIVFFAFALPTRSLGRRGVVRLVVMCVVLVPLLVVFSRPVGSRIVAAEQGGSQVHSTTFRIYTWQATIHMIRDNPWLGVGPGVFPTAYPRYTIAGPTKHAHQSYLQTAAETGIPALALLLLGLLAIAHQSMLAILKKPQRDEMEFEEETHEHPGPGITWDDLIPSTAWRMASCGVLAACVGSAVRNLVDSDWYVAGIALPFWILAGLLVGRSGAARKSFNVGIMLRGLGIIACSVLILLSVSFALGNLAAPDEMDPSYSAKDASQAYRTASVLSPLNPDYKRELGEALSAAGASQERVFKTLDAAIRLAPHDARNYYAKATAAQNAGEHEQAVELFHKALELNPNSTQAHYRMALSYKALGRTSDYESALSQLISIEDSDYEQIKGAPELVDTTYALAHAYFGNKYLAEEKYLSAANELNCAISRLERWRSHRQILEMQLVTGMISKEKERQVMLLLADCYFALAEAYDGLGNTEAAETMRRDGESVQSQLDAPAAQEHVLPLQD